MYYSWHLAKKYYLHVNCHYWYKNDMLTVPLVLKTNIRI
jgi:hypothetical protein